MVDVDGVAPPMFLMSQIYSLLPSLLGTHIQIKTEVSPYTDPRVSSSYWATALRSRNGGDALDQVCISFTVGCFSYPPKCG